MTDTHTHMRSIEQGRASFAYQKVKHIADKSDGDLKKKYKSSAKKLPVLIKTNGLAQTLAFIQHRDSGHEMLYKQIHHWLGQRQLVSPEAELVETVVGLSSPEYRRLSTETMALLNWIRRFVDGLMAQVEEDGE